jgi:Predicted transcriptional regulator
MSTAVPHEARASRSMKTSPEGVPSPRDNVTLMEIRRLLLEVSSQLGRSEPKKALRLPDVKELTGDSRSQIYARMSQKCAAYDRTWPLPFYIGKSPRWWRHEVVAWLEARATSTSISHH